MTRFGSLRKFGVLSACGALIGWVAQPVANAGAAAAATHFMKSRRSITWLFLTKAKEPQHISESDAAVQ